MNQQKKQQEIQDAGGAALLSTINDIAIKFANANSTARALQIEVEEKNERIETLEKELANLKNPPPSES